jgi:hypothetical protein
MDTLKMKLLGALVAIALSACNSTSSTPVVKIDATDVGETSGDVTVDSTSSEVTSDAGTTTDASTITDVATSDSTTTTDAATTTDAPIGDTMVDGSEVTNDAETSTDTGASPSFIEAGNCYINPQTHIEIINACTDATKVAIDTSGLPIADSGL